MFLPNKFHLNNSTDVKKCCNQPQLLSKEIILKSLAILTLAVPIPDEEKKLSQIFIFTLLCGAWKGFMKVLKTFIKPFEAPQRSVKRKF